MGAGRLAFRLFVLLLIVAIPSLAGFVIVARAPDLVSRFGTGTVFGVMALVTGLLAAVVSIAGRTFVGDVSRIAELANRGGYGESELDTTAYGRLASALDERDRQIAELAAHVRSAPIEEDGATVARSVVRAARSVTHDPTWSLAVLRTPSESTLPAGVYGPDPESDAAISDLQQWAATVHSAEDAPNAAQIERGPWGAFIVVGVAAGEELRAVLMAPWEGRIDPSRADLELLSLLGEYAGTSIEHALLYARLRAQTDELDRMSAVQTDFLRGITHDLQTPLTSIRATAAELREQPGLAAEAQTDLETIAHQADRLRRMVGQLLVVSRLEAGVLEPRQEILRVEPIVRRTWEALRADRPFTVLADGPAHLVVADPDRLEQVLWALLDNAVKYSPSGSAVKVRLAAHQADNDEGLVAEIAVSDEGAGMDSESVERAFEQFYRSPDARRLAPDGSGVGLYAARGLVRAMGGEIELRSVLGEGTTAAVSLPSETAEDEGADSPE